MLEERITTDSGPSEPRVGLHHADDQAPGILIGDDDQVVLATLKETLQRAGFRCWLAHNGRLALAIASSRRPTAILLDVNMPGMDGFEVLKELRGRPQTRNVPVILLTAYNQHDHVETGVALGADDYIVKPFEQADLLQRLQRAIAETPRGY